MNHLIVTLSRLPAAAPFVAAWRETGDHAVLLVLTDLLEESYPEWREVACAIRRALRQREG